MPTPGQLFEDAIRRAGLSYAQAAERIGVGYHNVYRWRNDREFTPRNRVKAARGLGLPDDYFDAPDAASERERQTERVFAEFARRPVAALLRPEQLRILRSMRFSDAWPRPSVALFEAFAAHMVGLLPAEEVKSVAEFNAAIDDAPIVVLAKPQPKLRRESEHRRRAK